MRIIWKDSNQSKKYKPIKYRGHYITGYAEGASGWVIDIPDDNNIYKSSYCAMNAIDQYYDGTLYKGAEKRRSYGIKVIGITLANQ